MFSLIPTLPVKTVSAFNCAIMSHLASPPAWTKQEVLVAENVSEVGDVCMCHGFHADPVFRATVSHVVHVQAQQWGLALFFYSFPSQTVSPSLLCVPGEASTLPTESSPSQ